MHGIFERGRTAPMLLPPVSADLCTSSAAVSAVLFGTGAEAGAWELYRPDLAVSANVRFALAYFPKFMTVVPGGTDLEAVVFLRVLLRVPCLGGILYLGPEWL